MISLPKKTIDKEFQDVDSRDPQGMVKTLIAAIATGKFKPGQKLVELQLCELFGVKRSKVREALRKLEHDGFVKITRNIGAVVSKFSRRDMEEIYDLLAVLEGMAVRIATPFVPPELLERLEILLDKMEATADPALILDLNGEFHSLLVSYSENRRLIKAAGNLRMSITAFGIRSFFVPGQIAASHRDHRRILDAIREGKEEKAERIMRQHLITSKNRLIKWIYKSL
jgi:DNA-binding GntR family transcriptional regulator